MLKAEDLPVDRETWWAPFLGIIGSADAQSGRQLDGMGKGISSLPKMCVVGRSQLAGGSRRAQRPDAAADHDYQTLLANLDRIRRRAGVLVGLASSLDDVPGSVLKIASVSPDPDLGQGLMARALSVGQPHKAIPSTVALAAAAAMKLLGSTVYQFVEQGGDGIVISHVSDTLMVDAKYDGSGDLELATVFALQGG